MIVTSSSWQNFGYLSSHRREDGDGDGDGDGEAKGEGDGGGGDGGDGGGLGDGGQGGLRGSLITIDHPMPDHPYMHVAFVELTQDFSSTSHGWQGVGQEHHTGPYSQIRP